MGSMSYLFNQPHDFVTFNKFKPIIESVLEGVLGSPLFP